MNPFPPPPPPPSTTFPPPPPYFHHQPSNDLSNALSSLTSLLNLSSITLHSLSSVIPLPSTSPSQPLIPCPFNPNHHLPLSSLFPHSLHCPSHITVPSNRHIQTLLSLLKYPYTPTNPVESHKVESGEGRDLNPTSGSRTYPFESHNVESGEGRADRTPASESRPYTNPFTLMSNSQSDLCFSLENYLDLENPDFFYSNCPGVVSFPINENPTPPMLTLPAILSSECANFGRGFPNEFEFIKVLLPSEVYAIRNETGRWSDFPFTYSYRVLRMILGLGMSSSVECLSTWVVVSSARCYNIVLDLAMRDHIIVLFKLCLKAIVRESIDLASKAEGSVLSNQSFKCPVLVQVLMWLATQLSVLYGEMNGKLFAINMVKQCICDCAFSSCMFSESTDTKKGDDKSLSGEPLKNSMENEGTNVSSDEALSKSPIFVSQVAAAVAALHERSMLEEKLKALRSLPSLPAYQRSMEHTYISNKADEERQKRPNYRALLEHDGFLWQRSRNNQDSNRIKTREELLAEERDYKRRRMSYRGKKMKRSTTQVMRDIIGEYMEEFKLADTINCPTKGAEEAKFPPSATYRPGNYYMDKAESGKMQQLDSSALRKGMEGGYRKEFHTDEEVHSTGFKDGYSENTEKASQWHHRHLVAERSNGRSRQERNDYSRSPNKRDGGASLREKSISREKRDYSKDSRDNFSRSSSRRYHKSIEKSSSHRERSGRNLDFKKRKAWDGSDDFEDRYDPSEP